MKSLFSLWQHRSIHLVRCGRLGHAAVQGRIHCESWSCQGCWAHVCAHSDCCMYYRSSSLCSLLSKFKSDFFLARVHRPRSFANDQSSLASCGLSRPITVQTILSSFCVGYSLSDCVGSLRFIRLRPLPRWSLCKFLLLSYQFERSLLTSASSARSCSVFHTRPNILSEEIEQLLFKALTVCYTISEQLIVTRLLPRKMITLSMRNACFCVSRVAVQQLEKYI